MKHNTALARITQVSSDASNDNPASHKPKVYITPSGKPSFVRSETTEPRKRIYQSGRKRWSPGKVISVSSLYLSDITKTITGRHGGPCDTHDGEIYYTAAVRLLVTRFVAMQDADRNPKPLNSQAWAQKHTPQLAADRPRAWFEDQERKILEGLGAKHVRVPAADDIAHDLNIRHAEVVQFKLRSVGAIDRDARQRKAEEKRADVERKRQDRAKDGDVIPHAESMAAQEPWKAYGISEPTFRRWVKAGKVPAHPAQRQARAKSRLA